MEVDGLLQSYPWAVNGTFFPSATYDQEPLLFRPDLDGSSNTTLTTLNNTRVDLILTATSGSPPHPIHKHSNKMFLIGEGSANFT